MDDYTIEENDSGIGESEIDLLFDKWMRGERSAGDIRPVEPPIPMPANMNIQRGHGRVVITRRWFTPVHIFTLIFAVIWNMIVFGFFWAAMIGDGGSFLLFFSLPFFAAGISIAYFSLAGLLNTTTIELAGGALSVRHQPLPWPGTPSIPAAEISQLYSIERVHHHSSSSSSGSRRTSTSYSYEVRIIHGSQRREEKLVGGLTDANQALFIEHTIEHHLGIVDRRVRGEIRRD